MPFDQIPIGEGKFPDGSLGASFFISRPNLEMIERDGPPGKYEDARFIPEAVRSPDAIFQDLRRAGHEKSLCYAVRPTYEPDDEKYQGLPRYGYAFLAFARVGTGGFVVFDWDWREEDGDNPGHPAGWVDAFGERTWRTS